jgi:hypothetical protein
MKRIFALVPLSFLACIAFFISAQDKPAAAPLRSKLTSVSDAKTVERILATFFGIAFREDGAIDEHGNYTLFSQPGKYFKEPGLNCSGYILAASRLLFNKNIPLVTAIRDRLGDSGAGAALGQDWDFGWDLILNITDGLERTLLLPEGAAADPAAGSGLGPLGFDLHSPKTWQELPSRIRPNHVYFASFTRPTYRRGYTLLHNHVGIIFRTSEKDWHLYHSIKKSGVVRENLGNEQSRARFLEANPNFGNARRHMFIVEVPLPNG